MTPAHDPVPATEEATAAPAGNTLYLQSGVTPEHHALLVEANAEAKAYPGGPERLAQVIAAGLAASRRIDVKILHREVAAIEDKEMEAGA
jgi:hypothetical protein